MFKEKIFQTLWENLSCTAEEKKVLKRALEHIQSDLKLRRFAAILPLELIDEVHRNHLKAQLLDAWKTLGPFGQVSVKEGFLIYAYVSIYLYPDLPFHTAIKKMVKRLVLERKDNFFIQTFLKANENNFVHFIETIPSMLKLYSNYQTTDKNYITVQKVDSHTHVFHFRSEEALLRYYLLPGMFEGFLELLNATGEVISELLDDDLLQLTIKWKQNSF